MRKILSPFEYEVLQLYLKGYGYQQIARQMQKPPKAIDNALQRIRSKVRSSMDEQRASGE